MRSETAVLQRTKWVISLLSAKEPILNRKPAPYRYGNQTPADRHLPASVIEQHPPLAEGVGTCFATDHNMGAQLEWLAHIEAGRIEVR